MREIFQFGQTVFSSAAPFDSCAPVELTRGAAVTIYPPAFGRRALRNWIQVSVADPL